MSGHKSGAIAWFVDNPVAANVLMLFLLIAGYLSLGNIPKELLPKEESRTISISMSYPAASPEEVQEGIVLKIEEALLDVEGIQDVQSVASLATANVRLTVYRGYDVREVMDDVKLAVDSIGSFPKEAERLRVTHARPTELAMQLQLYGEFDEYTAKQLAHNIKHELLALHDVKKVAVWGDRPYEIAVEVSEQQLLKYNVSLQQIADRIRLESVSSPSGGIRAETGNILLRVDGQSYNRNEFENIVLFTAEDGTMIRVRDIGIVKDDFVEWGSYAYFNGKYSVGLAIFATQEQDILEVVDAVRQYVADKQPTLPEGVQMALWADVSYYLNDRLAMMVKNLWLGAVLVFLVLALFMPMATAFWAILGLPVCFAGAFMVMPYAGISFNMVSLFGFILILGMLVDDAIVIAESVDDEIKQNGFSRNSVITGAERVALPAMFGVLTNMIAFSPMLFADGPMSHWLFAIGFIFCACMAFSILESKFVLPAHIHVTGKPLLWGPLGWQHRLQERNSKNLGEWVRKHYTPLLQRCVRFRYLTLSVFIALLIMSYALVKSGLVSYELFPAEPSDFLQVSLNMAEGTSEEQTEAVMQRIRDALDAVEQDYQQQHGTETGLVEHVFRYSSGGVNGFFFVELTKEETRDMDSFEIIESWRNRVGEIEGANLADFSAAGFSGSRSLSFVLTGNNPEALELATNELMDELRAIKGVSNLSSSLDARRQEYILHLKPQASALGLTLGGVALQVRQAFYGAEAQRIQRDYQEITVLVRYPKDQRSNVQDLENMPVRLSNGYTVPLREVAEIEFVMSPTRISRSNREMAVLVSAKVDSEVSEPDGIRRQINQDFLPALFKKYPSVSSQLQGFNLEQKKMEENMKQGFVLALLGVYVLLAIPLKSYIQPFMIMSVIPFGIVGAIVGHGLLGYPVSMMSIFGIIALSGMVVNDSLVMVDFVNQAVRDRQLSKIQAVMESGQRRFRAIMLTTATTFIGMLPMTLENSMQATNMIPMAISMAFGILFATTVTLILVPCLYLVLDDLFSVFGKGEASSGHTVDNG